MAQLLLADYLSQRGSRQRALNLISIVLKEATDSQTIRMAAGLRWQTSKSEDDFNSLFALMDADDDEDRRLAGAAYLFDQGKPEAALELLRSLLDRSHPSACLLAAEGDIRYGNCVAAAERVSSIKLDHSSPVEVRLGLAHLQALLVLECHRHDMGQDALEQLVELQKLQPNPRIDQLIIGLNDSE
jgi:tetratricopeptide (TPR) repeat protein